MLLEGIGFALVERCPSALMAGFRGSCIVKLALGFVVVLGWLNVQGLASNWIVAQESNLNLAGPSKLWCVRADSIRLGAYVHLSTCQGLDFPNERWNFNSSDGSLSLLVDSGQYGPLCLDSALISDGCREASFLLVLAKCSGLASQKWDHQEYRFQYGPSELTRGRTMFLQGFSASDCGENLTVGEGAPVVDFKFAGFPFSTGLSWNAKSDTYSRSSKLRHRFLGPDEEGPRSSSYGKPHDVELITSLAVVGSLGWTLAIVFLVLLWFAWRKYRCEKSKELNLLLEKSGPFLSRSAREEFDTPRIRHYGLKEIDSATESFTTQVGKEEFWEAYIGHFPHQDMAVVKRAIPTREYDPGFELEMSLLAKAQHLCLVNLLGFCDESGEHMVVFEYMPRGTLYDRLHSSKGATALLTWVHRMHIAYYIASGLGHLHQYMNPPIIHGNIKSSKIYLGENYSAKLADWCLAKLWRQDAMSSNFQWTNLEDTLGFPQVESPKACGIKTDVYNFGLVLLELLSGVPESEGRSLWMEFFASNQQEELSLVDPLLGKDVDLVELHAVLEVARNCVDNLERRRPCMLEVERFFKEKLWRSLKSQLPGGQVDTFLVLKAHK